MILRKDNICQNSAFFIAPGVLEIPNKRGGGIEYNIYYLARYLKVPSVIFSPSPPDRLSISSNDPKIKYSFIRASKIYPIPPYFKFSSIPHYISMILYNLDASRRVLFLDSTCTVVVFDKFFGVIPLIAAGLTGKKRIYMEYNIWPWTYKISKRSLFHKLNILFGRLATQISSTITVNSPSIGDGMISNGIDANKISIIPTGIDISEIKFLKTNSNKKKLRILYVGRLVEERGADLLPGIINLVLNTNESVFFTIVGGGPLFRKIKESLDADSGKNVELLGQVTREKVIEFINDADAMLFISKNENYGSLALLECMAIGCPVIATDVGSTANIIIDRWNGYLANPDAFSIANAIVQLADNRHLLTQMRTNSRQIAECYNWDIVASLFQEALSRI